MDFTGRPDASLIAMCDLFTNLEAKRAECLNGAETLELEDLHFEAAAPFLARQQALVKQIKSTPARTIDGFRAKAKAAIAWEENLLTNCQYADEVIIGSLLRDLIDAPAI